MINELITEADRPAFDRWLAAHDAEIRNEILDKVLNPEPADVYDDDTDWHDWQDEQDRKAEEYFADYPEETS